MREESHHNLVIVTKKKHDKDHSDDCYDYHYDDYNDKINPLKINEY